MLKRDQKKVGIVTCFLDNCGACLQAYALQQTIEKLGYYSRIIRFTEPWGYENQSWKQSYYLLDLIRSLKSRSFRQNIKNGKNKVTAYNKFRNRFLKFTSNEYITYKQLEDASLPFDMYVCGSDQIWNPTFYEKCNPAYYLKFVPDNVRKIAYAPSIGLSDIPEEYRNDFERYVKRFNYLSVRENKGVELVKKYSGREAEWVLDPTMLLLGSEWKKMISKRGHKKPYIFCYLFGQHEYYTDIIEKLRSLTGFDILIIPFSDRDQNPSYEKVIYGNPIKFLTSIYYSEYVLTDSFHATVFSLLFKKSFYVLKRDEDNDVKSMNSRIYSLLEMAGMQERMIGNDYFDQHIPETISENVFNKVNVIVEKKREESLYYLRNALEGK